MLLPFFLVQLGWAQARSGSEIWDETTAVSRPVSMRAQPRPAAVAGDAELLDPLSEPALPFGEDLREIPYPPLRYARFPGGAMDQPLRWDRVAQGFIGTCFFVSALVAIARTHPDFLSRAARRTGDGTYRVSLYAPGGQQGWIGVDDRFPESDAGVPYFSRGLDDSEIRPALFEKAFAKLRGGYHSIDGGEAADAFQALTGVRGEDHAVETLSESAIEQLLRAAVAADRPVVASTVDYATLRGSTGRDDLAGMIDDHEYMVVGVETRAGRSFVRLFTPLSPGDAGYDRDAPRFSEIALGDFKKYFDLITIGILPD